MLKISVKSISKPLETILRSVTWWMGKRNVVPVQKKGDKWVWRNCWLVSLLPICGGTFERLIYSNLFEFLKISNQSGFKWRDSSI